MEESCSSWFAGQPFQLNTHHWSNNSYSVEPALPSNLEVDHTSIAGVGEQYRCKVGLERRSSMVVVRFWVLVNKLTAAVKFLRSYTMRRVRKSPAVNDIAVYKPRLLSLGDAERSQQRGGRRLAAHEKTVDGVSVFDEHLIQMWAPHWHTPTCLAPAHNGVITKTVDPILKRGVEQNGSVAVREMRTRQLKLQPIDRNMKFHRFSRWDTRRLGRGVAGSLGSVKAQ